MSVLIFPWNYRLVPYSGWFPCASPVPQMPVKSEFGLPTWKPIAAFSGYLFCFFFFFPLKGEGYAIQDLKMPDPVAFKSLRNTEGDVLPNLRSRSLSVHLKPDSCLSWSGSFKKIDGSSLLFTVPGRDSEPSWSTHNWAVRVRKKDKEKV